MHVLESVVVLLTSVLALTWAARRLHASEPLVLLAGGCLIGLIPYYAGFALPHELILQLFLPALLYWESLNTSLRRAASDLRSIALQATGLVVATAVAVAAVAHGLHYPWPLGLLLGAVLAPTDATAVAAVARGMPRRTLTLLRTESLLNDGTALVLLAVAVQLAADHRALTWTGALAALVVAFAGGIAVGAVVGVLLLAVRRRLDDPLLHSGLSVATPFLAYLPAELAHASGVLAVVVCGLTTSRYGSRVIGSQARLQAVAFWQVASFLVNGALFVLVGIQLPAAARALPAPSLVTATATAAAVAATVVGTRLAWFYTVPYLVRALDRRPGQRVRRIGARQRLPLAWAGMRGAISLAAVLAVPAVTADGSPLPQRDTLVFITAVVTITTLAVLGPTLPAVVRHARFPEDVSSADEARFALRYIADRALHALPALTPGDLPEHLTAPIAAELRAHTGPEAAQPAGGHPGLRTLRHDLIGVKRAALMELGDRSRIDDAVLRRIQHLLDVEEARLLVTHPARPAGPNGKG